MSRLKPFAWKPVSLLFLLISLSNAVFAISVDDKYIVTLKDNQFIAGRQANVAGESVAQIAGRLIGAARQNQLSVDARAGVARPDSSAQTVNSYKFVYSHAIRGFSATLTPDSVTFLQAQPEVDYIVPDMVVSGDAIQNPVLTWGLDRIDQREQPGDATYEYIYDGSNVHVYVLDSGIRATHVEFSGRVGNGYDFIDNDSLPNDCKGHGTHVAGTIGGTEYGVAKNVIIHPVRVLDCSGHGNASQAIAGIDWVMANRQSPAVANMSLGGDPYVPLDSAVNRAINDGIPVVVSAGNDYAISACNKSPARVANAITVAASNPSDSLANYSNIGTCVDIVAPGTFIKSAWHTSDTATENYNGTSMAAPHVTGVVAQFLESNPSATPAEVANIVLTASTKDLVTNIDANTPNRLLYSKFEDVLPPEPPTQNLAWLIPVISLILN